jgi:large subunit ribosomal protein L19
MANQVTIKDTKVNVGDVVVVYQEKASPFEGRVISIRGREPNKTFMVRKIASMNIGVEKIYPVTLPSINKIEVKKVITPRRAKLYYLRDKKSRK